MCFAYGAWSRIGDLVAQRYQQISNNTTQQSISCDPPTIHPPNCVYMCVRLYMYVLVCACVCVSVSITKIWGKGGVNLLDMF